MNPNVPIFENCPLFYLIHCSFSGGGGGVRWMFANLDLEAHKASLRKDDIECKPLKRSGGSFDNTLAALC